MIMCYHLFKYKLQLTISQDFLSFSFFGTDNPLEKGDDLLCFCAVSEQK